MMEFLFTMLRVRPKFTIRQIGNKKVSFSLYKPSPLRVIHKRNPHPLEFLLLKTETARARKESIVE
nr:MAG TPA: hypothetical protein [Caudoviricetes sp.]